MIYHTYLPRPPLSQFVAFLWSSEGDDLPKAQVRLLPIGSMELVINLREDAIPLFDQHSRAQCGSTGGSRICGIHSEGFIIDNHSQVGVMGVHFKPGGGAPFFGLRASELHNQIVSLDPLLNRRAGELRDLPEAAALRDRLLETPTRETRFLVLERFLLNMMAQPLEQYSAVDFALREFQKSPTPTVSEVTNQIGFSARHFNQLFRNQVGLTPKLFCRIQRLRQVLYLLAGKKQINWMDVALKCGYFDQAHFIHDFRTFAGCTPTDYLEQRGFHPCHVVLPD
ncbi:MAG TPA: AraC family transcriptional regulator [Cyanobacteria bacterium UBA8543]|nr:AraC family transcriptional regulator [Cyanobacteria bacterium UBA8543]